MIGFIAGLYVAGGIWYYKDLKPYDKLEKASVIVWPMMEALRYAIHGLDLAAQAANRRNDRA